MTPSQPNDDARLIDFLRNRDAPCPSCGYNLRDLTATQCPECGAPLRLGLIPAPKHREISALLAGLWTAFGVGWFCWMITLVLVIVEGRMPYIWGEPELTRVLRGVLLYLMTSVFVAPIAQWRWRSLLRLSLGRRKAIACVVCGLTAISIATLMLLALLDG